MNKVASCPNNKDHKQFITTANVMEEWKVDEHGEFIEVMTSLQVNHGPDPANIWTCAICGAEAVVAAN